MLHAGQRMTRADALYSRLLREARHDPARLAGARSARSGSALAVGLFTVLSLAAAGAGFHPVAWVYGATSLVAAAVFVTTEIVATRQERLSKPRDPRAVFAGQFAVARAMSKPARKAKAA